MRIDRGAVSDFKEFLDKISPLKKAQKLGAILFQLPPSFAVSEFRNVERFLERIQRSTGLPSSDLHSSSSSIEATINDGYDYAVEIQTSFLKNRRTMGS